MRFGTSAAKKQSIADRLSGPLLSICKIQRGMVTARCLQAESDQHEIFQPSSCTSGVVKALAISSRKYIFM